MDRPKAPTLVLLPGMDGTGELFDRCLPALKADFEIVVVTYPCDIPLNYAELEAIARQSLPTDRPFVLLGESFSGPIAISLSALRLPQQVGLVLCSTFASNPRPLFRHLSFLIAAMPIRYLPVGWISNVLLGGFSSRALRTALCQAIKQVRPAVMRSRLSAVLAVDVSEKLARINVPTLYLRATRDWVVPETASRLVSSIKPDVNVIDVQAPHCLLQVSPREAARHIGDFFRAQGNS
ncbi:alpha/beta fold hydrolase [Pseudomonas sp. RT6P73]